MHRCLSICSGFSSVWARLNLMKRILKPETELGFRASF